MEQGKDIISIDNSGNYCAYQLKTGDIDLKEWRKILGEVKELIELPIIHPSVDKNVVHQSYLVTNGEVTDEVRIQIDNINEQNTRKNRGYSYLDIINAHSLISDFIDVQGKFMPKELNDFRLFLELYLADGSDFFPKEKYFDFFNNTIFKNEDNLRKSDVINTITSSIIIASYLLSPFQNMQNYFAIFEGWACLIACILRFSIHLEISKNIYEQSISIIMEEIDRNLRLIKDEVCGRQDFLEGNWLGDGGLVYKSRITIVLGLLAAFEINNNEQNTDYTFDEKLLNIIKKNINNLFFWGESSFPYFFNLVKYMEAINELQLANDLLLVITSEIVTQNAPRNNIGYANPYYNVNDVLSAILGLNVSNVELKHFPGSSFTLEPLILMVVRRNARQFLESIWRKITHIHFCRFIPDNFEDIFSWRTEKGLNYSVLPNETQSWKELKELVNSIVNKQNQYDIDYKDYLRYFLIVCPHRINNEVIIILDL
jgi:hypothetical protein